MTIFHLHISKVSNFSLPSFAVGGRQDLDAVRDSRVPGAGDHPEQGTQQGGGLVGPGGPHVRDVGRLPSFLRRQSLQGALREQIIHIERLSWTFRLESKKYFKK